MMRRVPTTLGSMAAEFEDGAQDSHPLMYTLCEDKSLPLSVRRKCIYDTTVGIRLHFMA